MSLSFSVYSPLRGVTGYDFVARSFIKEWYNQGHNFQLFEFKNWSNTQIMTPIDDILVKMENNQVKDPDFHINFCLLDQANLSYTCKNVIYTMFESNRVCKEWVQASKFLDLIVVPTEFNRKSFTESGINPEKILVCPPPLELNRILNSKKHNRKLLDFNLNDIMKYKHKFLNCSEFIARKNVEGLLQSWCNETKPEDDACLILKLNSNSGLKLDFLKTRLDFLLTNKKCAPIFLTTNFLSEEDMFVLYNSCTHYVTASFGEGWGLSESICGMLGKKIIAPGSSSFTDYLNKENSYVVGTQELGAHQDGPTAKYYNGSNWFAPIQFLLKKAIRNSITDENNADMTKNKKVQDTLVNKCESFSVSSALLYYINKCVASKNPIPFTLNEEKNNYNWLMICKSLTTKCGIADYTAHLFEAMEAEDNKKLYGGKMLAKGESVGYSDLIYSNFLNVMNLQLEYQFISPKRLKLFIQMLDRSGIIPTVTMHTVNPRAYDYHEVFSDTHCPLIVSSELMKETLIDKCGLSKDHNIEVIPMGISKNNIMTSNVNNEKFKIGFFGFAYPHKGIDKLISFMNVWGNDKECLILSTKPENDSGYFEKMESFVKSRSVGNIKWINEFLDEAEIVKHLSSCDLIFLPYSEYGGFGVSAAIRTCLKAGVPIMAFENSFFKDCVHSSELVTFVSSTPDDVSWGTTLDGFISEYKKFGINKFKELYTIKRDKFVEEYNWNRIAGRYLNYFQKLLKESTQK